MKLWLIGLGLALLYTVNAESQCSEDISQLQGKWFVPAMGSNCDHFKKHKKTMMLAPVLSITEDNKFKITTNFPTKEGCKKHEKEFEKQDDGTYVHRFELGEKKTVIEKKLEIVATDCETYILVAVTIQKKGKTSNLVAMYTKEPKLPDHLKEMFLQHARSLDIKDDQMVFPNEVACQNEE